MCTEEEESNHSAEEETPYHEQVDAFTIELDKLVTRFRNEFDLHLETIIGCLECCKSELSQPMLIDMGSEMLEEEEDEQV